MRTILITQRLYEQPDTSDVWSALSLDWMELFEHLGWKAILLPYGCDLKDFYPDAHGLILSGGNSLSCLDPNPLSQKRDEQEKLWIRQGLEMKLPILGVCRGMQLLASIYGSRIGPVEGHVKTLHELTPSKQSAYYECLQAITQVNSYHNFGVLDAPEQFIISATGPHGSIEAMEHHSSKIFAMMWHPEREPKFEASQMTLLKQIFS